MRAANIGSKSTRRTLAMISIHSPSVFSRQASIPQADAPSAGTSAENLEKAPIAATNTDAEPYVKPESTSVSTKPLAGGTQAALPLDPTKQHESDIHPDSTRVNSPDTITGGATSTKPVQSKPKPHRAKKLAGAKGHKSPAAKGKSTKHSSTHTKQPVASHTSPKAAAPAVASSPESGVAPSTSEAVNSSEGGGSSSTVNSSDGGASSTPIESNSSPPPTILELNTSPDTPSPSAALAPQAAASAIPVVPALRQIATQSPSPLPSPAPLAQIANTSIAGPISISSDAQNTGNAFNAVPNRVGPALFGVFGFLVLLSAALVAGICLSRRRQKNKTIDRVDSSSDPSNITNAVDEKSLQRSTLDSTKEINLGIAPLMTPSDPVTRYSHGGVTLLRRLESFTASLDQSPHSASCSSDGDSSMAHTPATDVFEPNTFMSGQLPDPAKPHIRIISSPASGLVETMPASADGATPPYPNILTFWEDPRRSLLRSSSDDGSINSPFQDEVAVDVDSYRQYQHGLINDSIESPVMNRDQLGALSGRLTPPNKFDFQVHHGDPHFVIEESS